jgi:4-diphosphocytidyl-2-C-methyl-D-erythritol kinase
MRRGVAAAKINLALVVGERRRKGKHELLTIYQRISLFDRLEVRESEQIRVTGFADDTLVHRALEALTNGDGPYLAAHIHKRIPVAAGLGGGSSDAAAALLLGNELLAKPLPADRLDGVARTLGADVPFFLRDGPQLGAGDGTELRPLDLPQDYWVLIVLTRDEQKSSTAEVYKRFDERGGSVGFAKRSAALVNALEQVRRPRDLAGLPANDLASSPVAGELRKLGAFRADVSGAGPAVYGLFLHRDAARSAQARMRSLGETWLAAPAWYV